MKYVGNVIALNHKLNYSFGEESKTLCIIIFAIKTSTAKISEVFNKIVGNALMIDLIN